MVRHSSSCSAFRRGVITDERRERQRFSDEQRAGSSEPHSFRLTVVYQPRSRMHDAVAVQMPT